MANQAGPRNVSIPKKALASLRAELKLTWSRFVHTLPASTDTPAYIGTFRKPSPPLPTLRYRIMRATPKLGPLSCSAARPDRFRNPPSEYQLRSSTNWEFSSAPPETQPMALVFPQEWAARKSKLMASDTRSMRRLAT